MILGFDFQSQIIVEILEAVFGNDTILVQIPGQFDGADYPLGIDPFHLQNFHVELGVVGNDDIINITDQFL